MGVKVDNLLYIPQIADDLVIVAAHKMEKAPWRYSKWSL